jgi:signal peptidase I
VSDLAPQNWQNGRVGEGRRAFAVVLALAVPGAGHAVLGRWRRGIGWAAADVALLALLPRLPIATALLGVGLRIASAIDAGLVRAPAIVPRWRDAIGLALAFLLGGMGVKLFARDVYCEAFKIPAGSMIPTLQVGDHVLVEKWAYRFGGAPERGDVIVFKYPREPDKDFVKRVVAIGGDTVELRDGRPYVNGVAVPQRPLDGDCRYDDYSDERNQWEERRCRAVEETLDGHRYTIYYDEGGDRRSFAPQHIPPGELYVLGDNRDNSHDSRYWGTVSLSLVKGRVGRIWFSMGRSVRWDRLQTKVH